MSTVERRIAHLDMDAFYASVELLDRPELIDRPVAIGGRGDPGRRGVVTTANYAARQFGIHSGMALRRARELCADCVFLPTHFDRYREFSARFKAAVRTIAPIMENRGIDEVFLDLSEVPGVQERRGRDLGMRIKHAVHEATGLSCSIGIAPNKLLAKIASDMNKPDGLTIIERDELQTRIWPMPARRINGIGPKASEKLAALGIQTIGELAQAQPRRLQASFGGHYARWLGMAAQGIDDRPVVTHSEPVSFSRETTFEHDLHLQHDQQDVARILSGLCVNLAEDLSKRAYQGQTVGIKLRYDDFRHLTRDTSIDQAIGDAATIRRIAFACLARAPTQRRIRLIGVRIAKLSKRHAHADRPGHVADGETPDLFGPPA